MKRPCYAVKDRKTGKLVEHLWYEDKMEAKKERNKLNPPRPNNFVLGTPERYYLTTEERSI